MPLTKATFSLISGAPANVLDYGAVGDGVTDDSAAFQAAVNSGASTVYVPVPTSAYLVNTPVKVPSGVTLMGANFSTGLVGNFVQVAPSIKKTTNTTALVDTWNGSTPTGVLVARDCVFYCDPAYFAIGSGGNSTGYYPQNFGFIGLSITGPGSSGTNAAIFCEFGSGLIIENVDAVGFTHGFWGRWPFSSTISSLRTNGRITCDSGGTSMLFNQCAAQEGYWITNFLYSTFTGCTSDGGSNPAYNITDCSGVVFNSCGSEAKTSSGVTQGAHWNFGGGNYGVLVNGGVSVGTPSYAKPTISVQDGDNIIFIGWRGDPNTSAGQVDLYVNSTAPSTNVKFIDCYFADFTKNNIDVAWLGAGAQITVEYQKNVKVVTPTTSLLNGYVTGSISYTTSGVAQNLYTFSSDGMYQVFAYITGANDPQFLATTTAFVSGSTARLGNTSNGSSLSLTLSGLNLQVTAGASSQTISYNVLKFSPT